MLPSFYLGTDHYANKCRYGGAVNYCHGSCLRSLAALNGDCFESCISSVKYLIIQTKDCGGVGLMKNGGLPRY